MPGHAENISGNVSKFKPNQKTAAAIAREPAGTAARLLERVKDLGGLGLRASTVSRPAGSWPADAAALDSEALQNQEFRAATLNSTRKLALGCTLAFVFFRFSFLHEFVASKYGVDTHVLLLIGAAAYLTCLLSGTAFAGLKYRPVVMWMAFAICLSLATLTSSWRGGSVNNVLIPFFRTTLPLVLLIPAVAYTSRDIQKIVNTIGIAGTVAILLGMINSDFREGRLELTTAGGTIQNANDYAAYMLLVTPAVAYFTMRRGRNIFFKMAGLAIIAMGFYEFLGTGSRGGLIALIVTILYLLKKGSNKLRIGLIVGIPLVCAFALPLIPGEAADRLASVFNSSQESGEAADSATARTTLLKESLRITFLHPLLGIGPGEFEDYQAGMATDRGERGMWHETHNAYTQVSSECGIPAIAFYLSAMFMTLRSLHRIIKAKIPSMSSIASTLAVMMVGFGASLFFLSQGYSFAFLVITGITVSIERLVAAAQSEPTISQPTTTRVLMQA